MSCRRLPAFPRTEESGNTIKKQLCILYYILRWRGEDRLQNFYALAYWKTDGAMLVQLSIKKLFLIFSASCSVESKGGRISCAVKVLSECAESEIRHNKRTFSVHACHTKKCCVSSYFWKIKYICTYEYIS